MILVTGTARQDSFDEVRRSSLEHVNRSRLEPGCLAHSVHIDCENPLRLVFVEQWTDRAALGAHFALPASRDFVRALNLSPPELQRSRFLTQRGWRIVDIRWMHSCIAASISYCNATYASLDSSRRTRDRR